MITVILFELTVTGVSSRSTPDPVNLTRVSERFPKFEPLIVTRVSGDPTRMKVGEIYDI